MRIYFSGEATHAQEQAVGAKLRQDSRVKQVVFVSKAQALAEFKQKFPQIYKAAKLPGNPLPDAFRVLPASPLGTRQIGTSIAHSPGVAAVKLVPCSRVT